MKYLILSFFIIYSLFAQSNPRNVKQPEVEQPREEQEALQEWNQEEEEARERAERERWILEERARGYEPTSKRYKPVMPRDTLE